jgi:hypothetical protein
MVMRPNGCARGAMERVERMELCQVVLQLLHDTRRVIIIVVAVEPLRWRINRHSVPMLTLRAVVAEQASPRGTLQRERRSHGLQEQLPRLERGEGHVPEREASEPAARGSDRCRYWHLTRRHEPRDGAAILSVQNRPVQDQLLYMVVIVVTVAFFIVVLVSTSDDRFERLSNACAFGADLETARIQVSQQNLPLLGRWTIVQEPDGSDERSSLGGGDKSLLTALLGCG